MSSELAGIPVPIIGPYGTQVKIVEEDVDTGGHFQSSSIILDMTDQDSTVTKDISFPFTISLLSAEFYTPADCHNDQAEFIVGPDTVIGAITSEAFMDDYHAIVSDTVIQNTAVGYYLKLFDGTNSFDCGRVLQIDEDNNKITFENQLSLGFLTSPTTYVMQTVKVVPLKRLVGGQLVNIGHSKIGGSHIPKDTILRCVYHNISLQNRKFSLDIEYLY